MKKVLAFVLLTVILLAGTIVGCGKQDTKTNTGETTKKLTIGFVVKTLSTPFYIKMKAATEKEAEKLGVTLLFQASKTEVDTPDFVNIMEDMTTKKVDGMVVIVGSPDEMKPAVEKVVKAGIPVATAETDVPGVDGVITYVRMDNVSAAQRVAEYVMNLPNVPKDAKVAILTGPAAYTTATDRADGYKKGLAKFPNVKIVAQQAADWDRSKGLSVTENIITANPDIKVIFASNDEMALGAYEAVKAAGKQDKIIVTGLDAIMDALVAVKDGRLQATLVQPSDDYGVKALRAMVEYVRDGKKPARYIDVDTPLVTKENVNEFIDKAK